MKRTMKFASAAVLASTAFAGGAYAGSLAEPVVLHRFAVGLF